MNIDDKDLAVFDLDGTLIHYEFDLFYEQTLSILPRLEYGHITRDDLHHFFSLYNFFGFVPETARAEFEERFWKEWSHEVHAPMRPFEGTEEVLDLLLQRGKRIAIATARSTLQTIISNKLEDVGLLKYIELVSTKHGCVLPWWNKTNQLNEVCRKMQVEPKFSFMVGDTPPDISSAKQIGFGGTIALLSGGIKEDTLLKEGPDILFKNISEIKSLLIK